MIDALVIIDDNTTPRGVARSIPYICRAAMLPISEFDASVAADAQMLIFDLSLSLKRNVEFLRLVFSAFPGKPKIVFTSKSDRQEIVQACAIGGAKVLGRTDSKNVLNMAMREIFRDAGIAFAMENPSATAEAARQADHLYTDIAQAVQNNEPLSKAAIANSAKSIVEAIASDGIDAWLGMVHQHHSHTYCHSMMVSGYAVAFARSLGFDEEATRVLALAGLLHDIGKVRIPLAILDKPGKLTEDEWRLVHRHPEYGRDILASQKGIDARIVQAAYSHHEFLDGSGYPEGLTGDDIPQLVRMLTICDIFSALTEERAYKDQYSRRVAYSILIDMGGKLDKALLKAFRPVAFQSEFGELKRSAQRAAEKISPESIARAALAG